MASSSSSPLSLFPLNMLLVGGYRRISKKNVLEHDARNAIYQSIIKRPGIDTKTLTNITGINENTLRYHLDRLVATGKISCLIRPGIVRYFQNQGAYSRFDHMVFHYFWTDTPRGILWLLYNRPGLTRQQIADAMIISGPSVTRQMDRLIEDGIVENRFPGRSNHYYLTAEAAMAIIRLISHASVTIPWLAEGTPLSVTAG
jgi:predicted transcriptional regulator